MINVKKIKDLYFFHSKSKIKASEGLDEGKYPFYTSSMTQSKWLNEFALNTRALVFGTGGRASLHFADGRFSLSTDCVALSSKQEELNIKFAYYYLSYNFYIIERGFRGAGLEHISKEYIENIEIAYPDLEIQNKIVAILDKVQAILYKRDKTITEYTKLRWSYFYSKFSNWKNFETKIIEDIASKDQYSLSSGPFGSNLTSKDYRDEGVLVLRGKNITKGKLDLSETKYISETKALELKRSEVKPNDIVIIAVGSSGKALKIPETLKRAIISQNFNKVTCNIDLINPTFFEYCFNSEIIQYQLKSIITDGGRTFLSLTSIKEIEIPLPPIHLQTEFDNFINTVNDLIYNLEVAKKKISTAFLSLSQLAFKGELEFGQGIDLEVLLNNDYAFFKENSNKKSIQQLLDRLNKNELNKNKFYDPNIYDKAKKIIFELLKEDKIEQVFDDKTIKLKLK